MMKNPIRLLFFAIGIVIPGSVFAEESVRGMMPVDPKMLLKTLPTEFEDWRVTKSRADLGINTWLESKALREFERPVPSDPDAAPGTQPPPPMWTRIQVVDTGKYADEYSQFVDFSIETPSESGNIEKMKIEGNPAFVRFYNDGLIVADLLVAERFLVEIVLKHQPKRNLKSWVRKLRLDALSGVADTEVVDLPKSFPIVRIDELNPKRNRGFVGEIEVEGEEQIMDDDDEEGSKGETL